MSRRRRPCFAWIQPDLWLTRWRAECRCHWLGPERACRAWATRDVRAGHRRAA